MQILGVKDSSISCDQVGTLIVHKNVRQLGCRGFPLMTLLEKFGIQSQQTIS